MDSMRVVLLVLVAMVVAMAIRNHRLQSHLIQERDLAQAASQDAKVEAAHKLRAAADRTARLARRNDELERALAQARGMQEGLRTAAQDAHHIAAQRIATNEREMAEMRLAAQVLWRMQTNQSWTELDEAQRMIAATEATLTDIPASVNGTRRPAGTPKRKALAANR